MSPTSWALPSEEAPGPRLGGEVAHLVCTLTGAAQGAPRTISCWSDGASWRCESDGGGLWVEGSHGTFWREDGDADVWYAPPGSVPVFRHPLPEVVALRSVDEAAAGWLDLDVPTAEGSGVHEATGRAVTMYAGDRLRVAVDAETGLVLDVRADKPLGPVALRVESLSLGPADGDLLGPVGSARPWAEFASDWEPAD
jgi:hypothetical protein